MNRAPTPGERQASVAGVRQPRPGGHDLLDVGHGVAVAGLRRDVPRGGAQAELKLEWTPAAEARMARIPSFVRNVVMQRVEDFARREGHSRITPEILDNVRKGMPVDFSKKLPFFLRKGKP